MKTNADYIEYFSQVVQAAKIEVSNIEDYVTHAVESGVNRFWGANNWTFKERVGTLTLSTSTEAYDLPDDFEGMKTIREENSNSGLRLRYFPREEFDRIVPKLSVHTSWYPQAYTVYFSDEGKKRIKFYPQPTVQSLDMLYYAIAPSGAEAIPEKFQSGNKAAIAVDIYVPGTKLFDAAYKQFLSEVKRLQVLDKYDMSNYTRYQDETDRVLLENRPWYAQ